MEYEKYNQRILKLLSLYLNDYSDAIKEEEVEKITKLGLSETEAVAILLATYLGLDINDNIEDKILYNEYIKNMIILEDENKYKNNPYYQKIRLNYMKYQNWQIKIDHYKPYQLFVCDDMEKIDGKIIPKIGYFNKTFKYDSIYQNNRLWMSITPNEINTMKKDIDDAFGNVCTLGLGMAYFTYMCARKENVKKVKVVELDKDVIALFKKEILPKFEKNIQDKIEIINMDAYNYLCTDISDIDYLFTDIYHDVSDGIEVYKKIKEIEEKHKNIVWRYWIEKTLKLYL